MKALLVGESRNNEILDITYELVAFAAGLSADTAMFIAGGSEVPKVDGNLYLADTEKYGEISPDIHKKLLLETIDKEKPDIVVFGHTTYGWDLAPRVAYAMKAGLVTEVVGHGNGLFITPALNSKLRRNVKPSTDTVVLTVQSGAFTAADDPTGAPTVVKAELDDQASAYQFEGYEKADADEGIDLGKAEVIVTAGRGVGKKENVQIIADLADAIGGELGASRPVVDAGWAESARQVGSSGQSVSPKLYIACGVSGSVQHVAGMKKSEFIVAVNTDKDAPIGELADVFVAIDLNEFVPALTEKLKG